MRPLVVPSPRLHNERAWPIWSLVGASLVLFELLYFLLVFVPLQRADVTRLAYAAHLGAGGYPLYWWQGDTTTLDPGLLYQLAQVVWLLLPLGGGLLLSGLAVGTGLSWPYTTRGAQVRRGLVLVVTLLAFVLAATTWGAAAAWFYG